MQKPEYGDKLCTEQLLLTKRQIARLHATKKYAPKLYATKLIALIVLAGLFMNAGSTLERISSDVTTRIWQDGTSISTHTEIFYRMDGTLVMRTVDPEELIIKTNRLGEMYAYNPARHSVEYSQNRDMSSETSQFYLFFQGLTDDMGLRNMGFRRTESTFEDGMEISFWTPPRELQGHIEKAELVHEDYRPIYMAMYKNDTEVLQRTYFHNYTEILDHDFPLRITTIQYESEQDSIVMQTIFENIRVNAEATSRYFDFKIPEDAEISR